MPCILPSTNSFRSSAAATWRSRWTAPFAIHYATVFAVSKQVLHPDNLRGPRSLFTTHRTRQHPVGTSFHNLWVPQRSFVTQRCLAASSARPSSFRGQKSAKKTKATKLSTPAASKGAASGNARALAEEQQKEAPSPVKSRNTSARLSSSATSTLPTATNKADKHQTHAANDAFPSMQDIANYKFTKWKNPTTDIESLEKALNALKMCRVHPKHIEKMIDFRLFDKAEALMKIQDIHRYDLHTFDTITDDMASSIEARKLMYGFISNEERSASQSIIKAAVSTFQAQAPGAALYVRVLHPHLIDAQPDSPVEAKESAKYLSNAASKQHSRHDLHQLAHREVTKVREEVEHILRRYVCRLIEPFPNELAIDLTHYATFLSLLRVSRRNVEQYLKDADDYIEQRPVNPHGVPGGPPAAEDTAPVSTDVLAAEIAHLIQRDVLLPRCDGHARRSHTHGVEEETKATAADVVGRTDVIRVCIGVATSSVMAKVACDAELAAVVRRWRSSSGHKNGCGAVAENIPLVSVRSLQRHTMSIDSTQGLIAGFPLARIPLFTPAFTDLMRRVFDVRTCGDLVGRELQLCFCFSPATFHALLGVAHGCLKFPIENRISLMSMNNLQLSTGEVRAMASNMISMVNADRTEFASSLNSYTRDSFNDTTSQACIFSVSYGRLCTDAELIKSVMDAVDRGYVRLHHGGVTFGRIHVALFENRTSTFAFPVDVEPGLPREAVLRVVEPQLGPLLQNRRRGGVDENNAFCLVTLAFQKVEPLLMIPPAMMEEAVELTEAVFYTKKRIRRCKWIKQELRQTRRVLADHASNCVGRKSGTPSPDVKEAAKGDASVDDIIFV